MLIYLAVAITATWLILVGMYIDPVEPDKESISLQKFTANVSDAELRNKLKDLRNSDAHQRVSVLVDVDEIVELTLKSTQVCIVANLKSCKPSTGSLCRPMH